MDGVIIFNDTDKCYQIYASDDVYHNLEAGEKLEVKVKENWVKTTIERRNEDDTFGWWLTGVGSCAQLIGHSARN